MNKPVLANASNPCWQKSIRYGVRLKPLPHPEMLVGCCDKLLLNDRPCPCLDLRWSLHLIWKEFRYQWYLHFDKGMKKTKKQHVSQQLIKWLNVETWKVNLLGKPVPRLYVVFLHRPISPLYITDSSHYHEALHPTTDCSINFQRLAILRKSLDMSANPRGESALRFAIVLIVIDTIAVMLRLLSRLKSNGSLATDDWVLVAALIPAYIMQIFAGLGWWPLDILISKPALTYWYIQLSVERDWEVIWKC